MTPSRPYLIRALYEWIVDNNLTPHLLVDVDVQGVQVPTRYVENGQILLNVSPDAVRNITLGNDEIQFGARFGGVPMEVIVPTRAVKAIYAKENGQGMMFTEEHGGEGPPEPPKGAPDKPKLRVVK